MIPYNDKFDSKDAKIKQFSNNNKSIKQKIKDNSNKLELRSKSLKNSNNNRHSYMNQLKDKIISIKNNKIDNTTNTSSTRNETINAFYFLNKLEKKELFLIIILIFSIIWLLLIIFSPYTILCLFILFACISILVYLRLDKFRRLGIINLLPKGIKYLLLNKSLLDILMDLWHLPTICYYLKFIINPIIYGLTPEQSLETIQLLDENVQDILKTKGIINLLNNKTKQLMLPSNSNSEDQNNSYKEETVKIDKDIRFEFIKDTTNNNNKVYLNKKKSNLKILTNSEDIKDLQIKLDIIESDSSNKSIKSSILNYLSNKEINNQANNSELQVNEIKQQQTTKETKPITHFKPIQTKDLIPLKTLRNEFKDNNNKYHPELIYFNNNNSEMEIEYNLNHCFKNNLSNNEITNTNHTDHNTNRTNNSNDKKYYQPSEYVLVNLPEILEKDNEVFYIDDDDVSGKKKIYKSVVITSSKKLEEERMTKNKSPYVWDNLQKYYKLKEKEAKTKAKQIFNFMELVKQQVYKNLIGKINKKVVYKSAAAFIAAFIIQIIINRGMRRYSLGALKTLIFLVTSIVTSMSVYVIANKYIEGEDNVHEDNENKENTIDVKKEMKRNE